MSSKTETSSTSDKITDSVLDTAAAVESKVKHAETTVRDAAERANEYGDQLSAEAQQKAADSLKNVEMYIREKPLQAAGIAFAAGLLTAVLLRK